MRTGRGRTRPWRRSAGRGGFAGVLRGAALAPVAVAAVEAIRGRVEANRAPFGCSMRTGRGRTRPWRRSAGRGGFAGAGEAAATGTPAFSVAPLWHRSRSRPWRRSGAAWRRTGRRSDARCAPGAVERGRGAALPVAAASPAFSVAPLWHRSRSRPWRRSGAAWRRTGRRSDARCAPGAVERGRGAALPVAAALPSGATENAGEAAATGSRRSPWRRSGTGRGPRGAAASASRARPWRRSGAAWRRSGPQRGVARATSKRL